MQLLYKIAEQEGINLKNASRLTGGDINDVFLMTTSTQKLVVKLNNKFIFPEMFKKEALALHKLAETNTFRIPKVMRIGELDNQAYLIMEHIESGVQTKDFWSNFGLNLAQLHKHTAENFGWEDQNYIGSLVQHNERFSGSSEFYISQRLKPQIKEAEKNGFAFQNLDVFYKNVTEIIPKNEPPALIHGDLWSGNYMVDVHQKPVLIDPAICFASREMDLAMMKLFGGFPDDLFQVYQTHYPLQNNWESRIELYQLYYLLVHLNLFGESYLNRVTQIIKGYS
jgi:fructosamine-3-kinase